MERAIDQTSAIPRFEESERRRHGLSGSTCLVALKQEGSGPPLFLMHAPDGLPWTYQPLVNGARWTCPIYAAREPDLDWTFDVLSLSQLATLYADEIKKVQPRGPYSLAGYSFGGTLAFEVARHLCRDGQVVRHLVMFDTTPPVTRRGAARIGLRTQIRRIACTAHDRGWIGEAALRRLGVKTLGARVDIGPGASSVKELRRILTRLFAAQIRHMHVEQLDYTQLCGVAGDLLKRPTSPIPWEQAVRFAQSEDPVRIMRAFKIAAKNRWHASRFRATWVYPGAITMYTGERRHHVVTRWQRHCSQPLDVRRFRVECQSSRPEHFSFMDPPNARIIAPDLLALLDSGRAPSAEVAQLPHVSSASRVPERGDVRRP